ncbi:hypothetical protein [Dactylosporangium sp. CA-092794]|uniref:hypothetical protein n=1 Tax=Dactylosporangium sp. CA-092794 TaxID=3239929 RepID=UPI003D9498E1
MTPSEPKPADLPGHLQNDIYHLLGQVKTASALIAVGCVLLAATRVILAWRSGGASEFGRMGWIAVGGIIIGSAASITASIFSTS